MNHLKYSFSNTLAVWRKALRNSYCQSSDTDSSSSSKEMEKKLNEFLKNNLTKVEEKFSSPSYFGYLSGVASSLWQPNNWSSEKVLQKNDSVKKFVSHKISRTEIANQTEKLVQNLCSDKSIENKMISINKLNKQLLLFPGSRMVAVQNKKLISLLLKEINKKSNISAMSRQCLALCGHVDSPRGYGVKILSIDGGGTRGMMGLEILQELENCLGGRKICEMFDIIVGVSTGAIIATLLAVKGLHVSEVKLIYMDISRQLFDQGKFSGVSGLLLSHSYYNTSRWVKILKESLGDEFSLIETSKSGNCPKLAIVSCVVNAAQLQPFVFRNYEHPSDSNSLYRGSTQYKAWEAIQASAAAPGYFAEVLLGDVLHQDGGVLVNNPTSIALHESRLLWPNEELQAIVSIGNGRSVTEFELNSLTLSTKIHEKFSKIIDSATDTELIHNCIFDLLPANVYFRFNPYMTSPYTLDEIRLEKLAQMERDAKLYTRRNIQKIQSAADKLAKPDRITQKIKRNFKSLFI